MVFRPSANFSNGLLPTPRGLTTIIEAASAGSAGTKTEVVISLRRCPTNYTQTKTPLTERRFCVFGEGNETLIWRPTH